MASWAVYVGIALLLIPSELVQDSWMTLVGGREIVQHGLPMHDHLAVWTSGARWIDQQWLAQLIFYGLSAIGGVKLVLLTHVAVLAAACAVALLSARLRGASERSVCLVALAAPLAGPWALQLRAQTLGVLLFVCVLALLLADARRPSRRVLLVLPLLALWANVHGTVLLGAALAFLRGALMLFERRGSRVRLLLLLSPLCTVASPYGLSLIGYYPRIAANPLIAKFVGEWRATTVSRATLGFFLLALLSAWIVGRAPGRLTAFERAALGLTFIAALSAIRNITWFALADLMVLPLAFDAALSAPRRPARADARLALGVAAATAVVAGAGVAAAQPGEWYVRSWPNGAIPALHRATADPSTRVLADDRTADWLLWQLPQLRGRLAYDVRYELFDRRQFDLLSAFKRHSDEDWDHATAGYPLLTVDLPADRRLWQALRRKHGARAIYFDRTLGVLSFPPGRAAGTLSPKSADS